MNLLTDPWIPIQESSKTKLITLEDVLCNDEACEIALSRDDMELACLQLLVCLTQVLFLPEDKKEWRQRIGEPLDGEEYQQGIQKFIDWFDLKHADIPFMQVRDVCAKKITPIQKLLVGLPEGNNHAFFNDSREINAVSESAAAIFLFNQAVNCTYGGGIKDGLRVLSQRSPITTLIAADSLRHTIWFNVLHKLSLLKIMPNYEQLKVNDRPTWVDPIKAKSKINAHEIGLLRGLFWQPMHIELTYSNYNNTCQFYNINVDEPLVTGFKLQKFGSFKTGGYDIQGRWIHPHSPRQINLKDKSERYLSFTTTAPAWTQLNHFLIKSEGKKEAYRPAQVVRQFHELAASDSLIVGGYRNKQASILQRRHDLFLLNAGWDKNGAQIENFVKTALEIKTVLRNKLYGFAKASGVEGIHQKAEAIFYHQSEPLIHRALWEMDWATGTQQIVLFRDELIRLSWQIFAQVTHPYSHEPKMIKALAISKTTLGKAFKDIKGETV